jgi:hypothetical protein
MNSLKCTMHVSVLPLSAHLNEVLAASHDLISIPRAMTSEPPSRIVLLLGRLPA